MKNMTLGGDEDEHGCLASSGYQWCNATSQCQRPWEEPCTQSLIVGDDEDEKGCIASAGYSWCKSSGKCQRRWEEPCSSDNVTNLVGDDLDIYGCIASAGYHWCSGERKCYRSWEDTCSDTMMLGSDSDENGCIATAGYSWCEEKQKCLRIWEEECESLRDAPTTTDSIEDAAGKVLKRISVGGWAAIVCAILAVCFVVVAVTVVCTRRRTQKQCEEASRNYKELLVDQEAADGVD